MQYPCRECGRIIERSSIYAAILIASLSGIALAQTNTNQPSGGTNSPAGTTQRQAPVGHRQPKAENLPPEVLQKEKSEASREKEEWDKRLTICKGC